MSETVTMLGVRGMSCASCVRHVEDALRSVPGVHAVAVDLGSATARVTHAPGVDVDAMITAIDEAGYEAGVQATANA